MAEIVPAGSRPPMPLTLPDMESIEPVHFDGWTAEDLDGWLTSVIPTFATIRRGIGLALWHLRQRVGDGPYGQFVTKYAKAAGVSVRTVGRWREDTENYYRLASPSQRSTAMRGSDSTKRRVADAESERLDKPQQGSAPVLLAEGDPAPDPVGVVRGERQRPSNPKGHTPAPAEPSTNGGGLAVPPAATLAARLSEMEPDDDEWEDCPRCRERPGKVRKTTPKVNNGCGHALIRRLGGKCQDCGEVVGPAPFASRR